MGVAVYPVGLLSQAEVPLAYYPTMLEFPVGCKLIVAHVENISTEPVFLFLTVFYHLLVTIGVDTPLFRTLDINAYQA